jgi:hypothetical protein
MQNTQRTTLTEAAVQAFKIATYFKMRGEMALVFLDVASQPSTMFAVAGLRTGGALRDAVAFGVGSFLIEWASARLQHLLARALHAVSQGDTGTHSGDGGGSALPHQQH